MVKKLRNQSMDAQIKYTVYPRMGQGNPWRCKRGVRLVRGLSPKDGEQVLPAAAGN